MPVVSFAQGSTHCFARRLLGMSCADEIAVVMVICLQISIAEIYEAHARQSSWTSMDS